MADHTEKSNPAHAPAAGSQPAAAGAPTQGASAAPAEKQQAGAVRNESQPVNLPDFAASNSAADDPAALGLLDDVTLRVKIELGRTQMYVEDVLRLNTNSVVELDKAAGDPVDIYVNDRHVARGEVLVLNENFCVRVSEIIQQVGTED